VVVGDDGKIDHHRIWETTLTTEWAKQYALSHECPPGRGFSRRRKRMLAALCVLSLPVLCLAWKLIGGIK
jgi:hypothetical protein